MCGRYYIADDDSDVMLAGYVAQAHRRADAMNLSLVTCHSRRGASNEYCYGYRPQREGSQAQCFSNEMGVHPPYPWNARVQYAK